MMTFPNRLAAPLTPDERLAEHYAARPWALMELAKATGNKALKGLAHEMLRKPVKGKLQR